jgi:hypothetical protein
VFGYSTIARIWGRKKFTSAGKPALVCLFLHVREYINEIKMYLAVSTLRSVYLYILPISLFRIFNKEKF